MNKGQVLHRCCKMQAFYIQNSQKMVKRIILFIVLCICICLTNTVVCQTWYRCDTTHRFLGGDESKEFPKPGVEYIIDFLLRNLTYPETAKKDSTSGTVYVWFKIDTNGNTIEHKIARGIRWDLNEEALRVVKLLKFDSPALDYDGKPAGICYTLPIIFTLDKDAKKNKKKNRKW